MTKTIEANFDGLVGQTHNYAGLSFGNRASTQHRGGVSRPKAAALQGLRKMKALTDMGLKQGVLLPHERPHIPTLRALGFDGTDAEVVQQTAKRAPLLLAQCYSASPMWVANAATVSPSADTSDSRVHFTPANLTSKLHRSIEHPVTARILRATFPDEANFAHHSALPGHDVFGDEGAANFMRVSRTHAEPGIEVMVYGHEALNPDRPRPKRFPARQSLESSEALFRAHGLAQGRVRFIQQNPDVIDAGVFHNDVIAVANERVIFAHEDAFLDTSRHFEYFRKHVPGFEAVVVPRDRVSVEDAVASYLFNSQLVTLPNGEFALIAAKECEEVASVWSYLQDIVGNSAIDAVHTFDLRESMKNGGGPACLRLRVVLTPEEQAAVNPGSWVDDTSYPKLVSWVEKHYRDELTPGDLADPKLLDEVRSALDELTTLVGVGSIYDFQR